MRARVQVPPSRITRQGKARLGRARRGEARQGAGNSYPAFIKGEKMLVRHSKNIYKCESSLSLNEINSIHKEEDENENQCNTDRGSAFDVRPVSWRQQDTVKAGRKVLPSKGRKTISAFD